MRVYSLLSAFAIFLLSMMALPRKSVCGAWSDPQTRLPAPSCCASSQQKPCCCLITGSWKICSSWVGYYKCPGLSHQWCKTLEQRQANPLSHSVCMLCETEEEKHGSGEEDRFRLKQLLRVCTIWAEPWEASSIPPHLFHFITPAADIHYSAVQASAHGDR